MIKKIVFSLFALLILSITSFVVYKMKTVPEQVIPYPYSFKEAAPEVDVQNNIVLMGDRMGKKLGQFLPQLEEALSKGLTTPLKVDNLTANHEGMHRTLRKLKSLKKFPKIIIYHGGAEEMYEKKFETNHIDKIIANFNLYAKGSVQTALLFSPIISHFVYRAVPPTELGNVPMYNNVEYGPSELFRRQELTYKLYQQEFQEFVEYIKARDSVLIVISVPYNLDAPPRKVCDSSITEEYKKEMENIQKLKQAGDYKSLYNLLDQLIKSNPGNAALYYEMGLTLKQMNQPKEGINYIQFSMAYDCEVWRGGEIYNVIAKRVAESNEVFYYDFSQMLKDQWGKNELYYDELYPQNLYYEQTMTSLGEVLKQTLKI